MNININSQSVGSSRWAKLKYLRDSWMNCHDVFYIYGARRINLTDFGDPVTFLQQLNNY